ncbi:HNH endonuclease signature motif containing protein [Streptomyces polyrhachis]|uniref:HNH endonuclease signature motif containing protein n=1 Tax=Streptomyces polyrhachis TaxID=1282885 RepID=A0ABW2GM03_9ACTN
MAIGNTARKVLWARSSDLCAFSGCNQRLTVNLHDDGSQVLEAAGIPLGEEAHIISGSKDGPRFDSAYPADNIDSYENLILLCPTHHRLIDKRDGMGYSVETLRRMKADHEAAQYGLKDVQEHHREEIELRVLALTETWAQKAGLNDWQGLTWRLNTPVPRLSETEIDRLTELAEWVATRYFPGQHPEVKRAFDNYAYALSDVVNHIRSSMEPIIGREGVWEIYREYKHRYMSQPEYDAALKDFHWRTDVLYELSLELTKATNYVCTAVRSEIDPLYRFEEGILPHRIGDGVFVNRFTREEYDDEALSHARPYPGIEAIQARVREQGGASR